MLKFSITNLNPKVNLSVIKYILDICFKISNTGARLSAFYKETSKPHYELRKDIIHITFYIIFENFNSCFIRNLFHVPIFHFEEMWFIPNVGS